MGVHNGSLLLLQPRDLRQPLIPSTFEFSCDNPVFWFNLVVLTPGAGRFVARLLEGSLKLINAIGTRLLAVHNGGKCRLNGQWRDRAQNLGRDRRVDAHVAEGNALVCGSVVDRCAIAEITGDPTQAVVLHCELASTMTAAKQADQEAPSVTH